MTHCGNQDGPPLCQCGCGRETGYYPRNYHYLGIRKGDPIAFKHGHGMRKLKPRIEGRYEVDANGCWLWTGYIHHRGYAPIIAYGRVTTAHRVSYEQHVGPIPEGRVLDHLCRVRHCVNPDHLEPVVVAENNRRGLLAKLTSQQAVEIRQLKGSGESGTTVGRRYGVSKGTVYDIWHGRTWADAS